MLSTYRRVLSLPGALAFSLSGVVARLPISMVGLGIVLLVSTRTGSYSLAGGVSAAYVLANALFAIVQGRLADRIGQRRLLSVGAVAFSSTLALMMAAVEWSWGTPAAVVFAASAGATQPQVGSLVRARWSYVVPERPMLQTAFAFEAVMDETVFMVGPTVVTLLATAVHPLAGLTAAIAAGLLGAAALVVQRRTEPPAHPPEPVRADRPRMPWTTLGPLVVASAAIGALFGSTEVATVAFSEELGTKAASGPLLATWALGSLLSGIITGAITWRATNATRFRWGALVLAGSVLPLPFIDSFLFMALVLVLAGFAISPTLIALTALVEEVVPTGRLTEGMAIVHTGIAGGVAPGAVAAGAMIDRFGAGPSYWVPVTAGALGVAAAMLIPAGDRRIRPAAASPTGSSM